MTLPRTMWLRPNPTSSIPEQAQAPILPGDGDRRDIEVAASQITLPRGAFRLDWEDALEHIAEHRHRRHC